LGFRVPALLVAPWAASGAVSHEQFDHTSVLKMIEWRWGLEPLTVRDATANNLADALDFKTRHAKPPLYPVPPGPFGAPCLSPPPPVGEIELDDLVPLARAFGWRLPAGPAVPAL
jgi:phospholipase C